MMTVNSHETIFHDICMLIYYNIFCLKLRNLNYNLSADNLIINSASNLVVLLFEKPSRIYDDNREC